MSEFDTGGSSTDLEEGNRSNETPTESSRARNWSRGEYALLLARAHASLNEEDGKASNADTAWRDVVCAWLRLRATATASSKARAASSVKHCLAALTGVGIAGELIKYMKPKKKKNKKEKALYVCVYIYICVFVKLGVCVSENEYVILFKIFTILS